MNIRHRLHAAMLALMLALFCGVALEARWLAHALAARMPPCGTADSIHLHVPDSRDCSLAVVASTVVAFSSR